MDTYPVYFRLGERYATYTGVQPLSRSAKEAVKGAAMICPAIAISIVNELPEAKDGYAESN